MCDNHIMSENKIKREEARARGSKFFEGSPCKKDGTTRRYVSTWSCVQCHANRGIEGRRSSKEKQREYEKTFRDRHKERLALKFKLDRKIRPEIYRKRRLNYYDKHKETILAKSKIRKKEWRTDNPEYVSLYQRWWSYVKRCRKLGNPVTATIEQMIWLRDMQGGCCAYCGSSENLELDHKTAISRGGGHELHNIHWLCHTHNASKRSKSDMEFRAAHGIPSITQWDASYRLLMLAAAGV